ncbi:MAG: DNA translocase FtsK [Firmicutes bacterium]|nr:DNA translocase FtsK [Bacillota bacterium]
MGILIFNVSIFGGLRKLYEIISYHNDYEDDFDDDYEEDFDDKPIQVKKSTKAKVIEEYDLPPAVEEESEAKKKGNFFSKRLERPVFDKPEVIQSKTRKKLTLDAEPGEEYESPYHIDSEGRVLGIDLFSTKNKAAESISLYPAKPYDPNDDESDINALFTEDSEAEYDELLREAEDLFKADEEFAEITSTKEVQPAVQAAAQPVKAAKEEELDTPPWEEPADRPQIIEAEETKELDKLQVEQTETYQFPKLEFLGLNPSINQKQTEAEMIAKGEKLRQTLLTFGVEARVDNICTGPTVTRYELIPKQGTRVNAIVKLEQDIALALAAATVRIEAPIPGKSAIGIEIPNDTIQSVYYSEVLRTEKFQNFKSKIGFGIGKDIAGNVVVYDIAKAPHMLIAGATGAGKSVCINTLITSILYKATPDEVRLIMVDPKVVELSVYNGIPHLLIPVVTDPKQAAGALNWAVREMMRRYDLFATTGTRNLQGYNAREDVTEKLPQIVIIIDELADLMMIAKKAVEEAICRIAQLARAAGIHLIIATQRPSVDVITGLIKANIPTRIAFKVSSGMDSRTVLDTTGAEKLLGRGDMLFRAVDMNKPLRIQGAFVTDEEVAKIVDYIKTDVPNYDQSVLEDIERAEAADSDGVTDIETNSSDELIDQVIDFIVHTKKASTSAIQRKFRIGFNRAGRIIDELEDRGIVGPENGSKPREVLMTPYERSEYKERHENY